MSTNEVIAAAQAVIDETEALSARKAEAVSALRLQRDAIDQALAALGADEPAPAKRKPRKTRSDKGQPKRKEVTPQATT